MRFLTVVGVLLMAATSFGDGAGSSKASNLITEINGLASNGLEQSNIFKYKMAGLCKFVGQMIPLVEKAETLSEALEKSDPETSGKLMRAYGIVFTAEVNICTATQELESTGPNPAKDAADEATLTKKFQDLISVTAK